MGASSGNKLKRRPLEWTLIPMPGVLLGQRRWTHTHSGGGRRGDGVRCAHRLRPRPAPPLGGGAPCLWPQAGWPVDTLDLDFRLQNCEAARFHSGTPSAVAGHSSPRSSNSQERRRYQLSGTDDTHQGRKSAAESPVAHQALQLHTPRGRASREAEKGSQAASVRLTAGQTCNLLQQ